MTEALLGLAGTIFTGIITLVVHLIGGRSESNKIIVEQYRSLPQDQRNWTEASLKERDQRITRLEKEMQELRHEVRTWKQKFQVAIAHIVELRAPGGELPPIPEEIRDDLL